MARKTELTTTPKVAKRLALIRQRLAGPRPPPTAEGIMEIVRDIGCLQIDPVSIVAPSTHLVLWSRLGHFNTSDLDKLLWEDRLLFENFAHAASIVPTTDFPIFNTLMKKYFARSQRIRGWVKENRSLQQHILSEIRRHGALPTQYFKDKANKDWESSGWSHGKNVSRMLSYLWVKGQIMVANREGNKKYWDLTKRVLPNWVSTQPLPGKEVWTLATQKTLRALGVARADHIKNHYLRGGYFGLSKILKRLTSEGHISQITIRHEDTAHTWPGTWYIHTSDLETIRSLEQDKWEPRLTLLSPFDNLICDRKRTEQLFNFKYSFELYVPKDKRKFGTYVLPILDGDRFIGRIDPKYDKEDNQLRVNAVYLEPELLLTTRLRTRIKNTIAELAKFLGTPDVVYTQDF
ncbi:MAG: winged helix-turn-helix domain-containing protein [Candidatus Hodarchaeota archaeon]